MTRRLLVAAVAAIVIALPFVFDRRGADTAWRPGDPVLVVITPHNEAIRAEFAAAFSAWHAAAFGRPVKVDWRTPGGTTEIMRYLSAQYASARRRAADPARASCKIDLLFGGGVYDHDRAAHDGFTVPPWPDNPPRPSAASSSEGRPTTPTNIPSLEGRPKGGVGSSLQIQDLTNDSLYPPALSGEIWRTNHYYGTCLSTFGLCYNPDRLAELGIARPPSRWSDLADPRYRGHLGLADPTKSGSIAKCFEMIVQEQCAAAVRSAGFADAEIGRFEAEAEADRINTMTRVEDEESHPVNPVKENSPRLAAYQAAVERGWLNGLRLIQRLGANARYFTDSAGQVPIDVGTGNAAAGLAIDFYARTQAEMSRGPNGEERLVFVAPAGGTSVSADPISLLRGAEHRDLAVRFMRFVLDEAGQRLWTYRPGTPGGPARFALRRLPIRRDFYPGPDPAVQAAYERHQPFTADPLGDPAVNPYALAAAFTYRPGWTARHFGAQRDLIRAMCMDAGDELRAAWAAIAAAGGPERCPDAVALLERMPDRPEPLTWASAPTIGKRFARMDYKREWTAFFRRSYREAREAAREPLTPP